MEFDLKRKRKQNQSQSQYPASTKLISVRSLVLCSSFFIFLLFLSADRFSIASSSSSSSFRFRPILTVSNPSLLSSLASFPVLRDSSSGGDGALRIEDRILFPDHLLLFVSSNGAEASGGLLLSLLNCVYYQTVLVNDTNDTVSDVVVRMPVLSTSAYDEFRSIVRCPLPPVNYSSAVHLERNGVPEKMNDAVAAVNRNRTVVHNWDTVVYEAALDGDTAVVFLKGLNLKPGRESDQNQFSCHFGLGNWDRNQKYVFTTKAVTAAQEVVRCLLPRSIRKYPNKAQGFRVTIGVDVYSYLHSRTSRKALTDHLILPSVAKISNSNTNNYDEERKNKGKYELCVCTMVWNQAHALREWITYHSWLGVERWFIYDNNSDDNIKEVIDDLELRHYNVSGHTWPWIKTQEAGFSHCALRAKDECKWVGFFDVDEFFNLPFPSRKHRGNLPGPNSLRSMVANISSSSEIGEIRTACHSFGPSGLSSTPKQGAMVGYTCRLQAPERHKSIVRLDALDPTLLNVVHHFRLKKGFKKLDLLQSTALINHYKYQVWESFRAKFFRRVATYVVDWQENQNEGSKDRAPGLGTEAIEPPNWRLQFCEVWDTSLRDFVLANLADPETRLLPWEERSLHQGSK